MWEREQRQSFVRAVTAHVLAAKNEVLPAAILRRAWPTDRNAELILRAAQSPMTTNSGAALTIEQVATPQLAAGTEERRVTPLRLTLAPSSLQSGRRAPSAHKHRDRDVL